MNKHALLMLACCLVPLALFGAVYASQINLGSLLPFAIVLLCPLMHILMMRGMGHDHSAHQGESPSGSTPLCHSNDRSAPAEPTASRR